MALVHDTMLTEFYIYIYIYMSALPVFIVKDTYNYRTFIRWLLQYLYYLTVYLSVYGYWPCDNI